jgi:mono/diheme cytochrome c family protein
MKRVFFANLFIFLLTLLTGTSTVAAGKVDNFEIEGLISAASPVALSSELEKKLKVNVVEINLKNTESGWPVFTIEFDPEQLSREDIEKTIATIEDPAGHNYQVHKGPPIDNAAFTDEELKAMAIFSPTAPDMAKVTNPVAPSDESLARGKEIFEINCSTCHGMNGNGQGPASHGITTFPRQLWSWYNTDSSTDAYLYWFITNGRNEMPPWGLVLSDNERWDVINYVKTLKKPE